MNKILLVLLLVLILPAYAGALDLPFIGGDKEEAAKDKAEEEKEKGKTKFLIRLKSGGELATDNYTVTDDNVVVMMPSGAIYLEKDMVESIEEVAGIEEETLQTIDIDSGETRTPGPFPAGEEDTGLEEQDVLDTAPTDDEGHTEQWWRSQINEWKSKKAKAEKKYSDAEAQWAKADGDLTNLNRTVPAPLTPEQQKMKEDNPDTFVQPMTTVGSEYDIIRLQDLRGSARVAMDRAEAEIEEARYMLEEELPEQARLAGAPPGWVR